MKYRLEDLDVRDRLRVRYGNDRYVIEELWDRAIRRFKVTYLPMYFYTKYPYLKPYKKQFLEFRKRFIKKFQYRYPSHRFDYWFMSGVCHIEGKPIQLYYMDDLEKEVSIAVMLRTLLHTKTLERKKK
jgi:hypothetical protein